ncbi:MAG TPA: YdeI/OmpD-associated family protein [Acidimicrobiales bacterium]|nr:YdeI/OmpD-associated family protein [Acidimicrobiales bacterium]
MRLTTVVRSDPKGRVYIPLAKDPGVKHLCGTVNGMGYRGEVQRVGDDFGLVLGPAWRRDCGVTEGDRVVVVLEPEGPQRGQLAPDVEAALAASKEAAAFWDGLAQFYRKAYLRHIDATTRSPEKRASRIAEVIGLLEAGRKER